MYTLGLVAEGVLLDWEEETLAVLLAEALLEAAVVRADGPLLDATFGEAPLVEGDCPAVEDLVTPAEAEAFAGEEPLLTLVDV